MIHETLCCWTIVYENVTWDSLLYNCLCEWYMRLFVAEQLFMRMLHETLCCRIIVCVNVTWDSLLLIITWYSLLIIVYENVTRDSLLLNNCLWECYMRIFVAEQLFMRMLHESLCCIIVCENVTWESLLLNNCLCKCYMRIFVAE
jgi:hypothetical protein